MDEYSQVVTVEASSSRPSVSQSPCQWMWTLLPASVVVVTVGWL